MQGKGKGGGASDEPPPRPPPSASPPPPPAPPPQPPGSLEPPSAVYVAVGAGGWVEASILPPTSRFERARVDSFALELRRPDDAAAGSLLELRLPYDPGGG